MTAFDWQEPLPPWGLERQFGPSREELAVDRALAYPDENSALAGLPLRTWGATVYGTASMNTTVLARTAEEAARLAVEGFESGDLTFDEPRFGGLEADVELYEDAP